MRIAVRFASLFLLLMAVLLLAACSLAAPAPVGQSQPQAQQPPAAQQQPAAAVSTSLAPPQCRCGRRSLSTEVRALSRRAQAAAMARWPRRFRRSSAARSPISLPMLSRAPVRPKSGTTSSPMAGCKKGMPGFSGSLDADQRWDVIAYAWSLAASPQQVERGKQVYAEQCVQCHGDHGKGDGKDAQGKLPDLSDFATLAKVAPGIWDQAMASGHVPSFAGTVSEADRRAAIDYVRTFAYDYPSGTATAAAATPRLRPVQLPSTPDSASRTEARLTGYIINGTPGQSLPANLTGDL